ncbi:MAG: hypothetical protein OSA99_20380 [Acidimicrobiales bacterium]|nr:hypothetical protein [Acidimicrobiales bacterium]
MTIEKVLDDYADLERDDLLAALEFRARTAGMLRPPRRSPGSPPTAGSWAS